MEWVGGNTDMAYRMAYYVGDTMSDREILTRIWWSVWWLIMVQVTTTLALVLTLADRG